MHQFNNKLGGVAWHVGMIATVQKLLYGHTPSMHLLCKDMGGSRLPAKCDASKGDLSTSTGSLNFRGLTRSGKDLSFFSAHEDVQKSPNMQPGSPERQIISTNSPARQRSPGIEKAMRDKAAQENALRSKLSSLTRSGSPFGPLPPAQVESSGGVLSPSQKHEQQNMKKVESPGAKMASDVFGLGIKQDSSPVEKREQQKTLMDYTTLNTSDSLSFDGRPECQQS